MLKIALLLILALVGFQIARLVGLARPKGHAKSESGRGPFGRSGSGGRARGGDIIDADFEEIPDFGDNPGDGGAKDVADGRKVDE